MKKDPINAFYDTAKASSDNPDDELLRPDMHKEIGHFDIFEMGAFIKRFHGSSDPMPYNRRGYFKLSLVQGKNRIEYADKVVEIDGSALVFGTPKIPYHWIPLDLDQKGYFCIFTEEFLISSKSGLVLDELPVFKPGGYPVFVLTDEQVRKIEMVFSNMRSEIDDTYAFKYDLIRTYLMELIHYGQKLQPLAASQSVNNAAERISGLFLELLERQFPITSQHERLVMRTAKDFADRLAVHTNYLNKLLKERTGKTTTELIFNRIAQEAKVMLKDTSWNIAEIAYCLGFEQPSHFSKFFKKQTDLTPNEIRVGKPTY